MIKRLRKYINNLVLRLHLRNFKKVLELRSFFARAIMHRIRNFNEFKSYGHDDEIDNLIFRVTDHILKIKVNDSFNDDLQKLKENTFKDEKLLQLINAYETIHNISIKVVKNDPIKLNYTTSNPFIENLGKQPIKKVRKKLRQFIKDDLDDIIDRSTFKLNFKLNEFVTYLTLATSLIFIGGYIYNKIFFTLHGINISLFFEPSDYIFAAIEQIRFALISGIFALIGYFSSLIDITRNYGYYREKNLIAKRRKRLNIFAIVLTGLFVFIAFKDIKSAMILVYPPMYLLIISFANHLTFKYFEEPIKWYPIFLFVMIFMYNVIYTSIDDFIGDKKIEGIELISKDNTIEKSIKDFKVIGVTSAYFVLKNEEGVIKIIEKKDIKLIKKKK